LINRGGYMYTDERSSREGQAVPTFLALCMASTPCTA
jgi:hypothetical protein